MIIPYNLVSLIMKTNQQKENLVNKFDTLFYSIENIDTQNKYLRDVLRLIPDEILKGLIKKMGDKT